MTSFPTTIKTKYTSSANDKLNTAPHSTLHNNLEDEVIALQTKVGVNSSAITTTHDYKLSGVTGSDKAVSKTGTETLTNKTLTSPIITNKTSTGTDTGAETLTNKTLTSPSIDTPTLVLANTTPTADGGIGFDRTNENLVIGDGTNSQILHMGVWKTWTPTFTNLTVGNGTLSAYYAQIGKTVLYRIRLIFGTTTSISGAISVDFPASLSANYNAAAPVGNAVFTDENTLAYFGQHWRSGQIVVMNSSPGYVGATAVQATIPFTWTTTDKLDITGSYEAA